MLERFEQERARIRAKLLDPSTTPEQYGQYYAAQQALGWAANSDAAAAPFDVIDGGKVQPLIWGTRQD